jgi:transcription elongation factor GreA
MSNIIPISREGHEKLLAELDGLRKIDRPNVRNAIAEARAHGDLSENAEYHAAKERQRLLEEKIGQIESRLSRLQIVSFDVSASDTIIFGCKVKVRDPDDGFEEEYHLVGADESDPSTGKISTESPIGKALIGKRKGETVEVVAPRGTFSLQIVDFC